MSYGTAPEKTYTVQEFIESGSGSNEVTHHNFSLLYQRKLPNGDIIQIPFENIIDDYMEEIREQCVTIVMTEMEKIKYFYNPDLLSYDCYGTINLDFLILKINGIIDPKEFDLGTLKLLPNKAVLSDLLSSIYNAETGYIEKNRELENIME